MINHFIINDIKFTLPESGRVLIQMTDDEIASAEILRPDQHIANLQAFLEIAECAGYTIIPPEFD